MKVSNKKFQGIVLLALGLLILVQGKISLYPGVFLNLETYKEVVSFSFLLLGFYIILDERA